MSSNRISYDGKVAGLYDLGDTLGRGHFAVVKSAKHVFTGEQVAVKVIDKSKLDDVSRAHLFQEVRCMKLVQHPNVVRLYEVIDTQTKLYLILEFGDGGDMYDYIMKHEKGIDETSAKKYFKQIVNAISYCHRLHVVHRDLKPENVVFFEKLGMVKLTDFGFSNKFYPGQKLETSCGSLAYSAPEILLGDSYDAPKVDVWSLGVILYMLVTGHAPFQEANDSETLTMIMDCKYTVPPDISDDCQSLIAKMLIRDPEKRSTLDELMTDPWLNSSDDIQPADYLPLISREHLSDEDHTHIIQKMNNGNIATKEEILEAVDKNEYNHITATYYLLAERKLRVQRQEKVQQMNSRTSRSDLSPIAITPGVSSASSTPSQEKLASTVDSLLSPSVTSRQLAKQFGTHLAPPGQPPAPVEFPPKPHLPLQRKCSIVREEEDSCSNASGSSSPTRSLQVEEMLEEQPEFVNYSPIKSIIVPVTSACSIQPVARPAFSLPVSSHRPHSPPFPVKPSTSASTSAQKFLSTSPKRKLHAVQSSPHLLMNEINEEEESDLDPMSYSRLRNAGRKHVSVAMRRMLLQHQRYSRSRGMSCSSSEASDDDDVTKQKVDKSAIQNWSLEKGDIHLNYDKSFAQTHRNCNESSEYRTSNSPSKQFCSDKCSHCKPTSKNKKTTFTTDSTDSLDLLSENHPRLMYSMSCGDLSSSVERSPSPPARIVHADSITITEIPDEKSEEEEKSKKAKTPEERGNFSRLRNKISTSLSLSSGLSCLYQARDSRNSDKNSPGNSDPENLRPDGHSVSQGQLDINQNGWRKNEAMKRRATGNASHPPVVDVKLSSKCCTLC